MQAQSSLRALAGAVIDRTIQRTLSAQNNETTRTLDAHCSAQKTHSLKSVQIGLIRSWLFRIGEPVEDHEIVLNKCTKDPEALAYFFKHARGEF